MRLKSYTLMLFHINISNVITDSTLLLYLIGKDLLVKRESHGKNWSRQKRSVHSAVYFYLSLIEKYTFTDLSARQCFLFNWKHFNRCVVRLHTSLVWLYTIYIITNLYPFASYSLNFQCHPMNTHLNFVWQNIKNPTWGCIIINIFPPCHATLFTYNSIIYEPNPWLWYSVCIVFRLKWLDKNSNSHWKCLCMCACVWMRVNEPDIFENLLYESCKWFWYCGYSDLFLQTKKICQRSTYIKLILYS